MVLNAASLVLLLPSGYPGAVAHQAGQVGSTELWSGSECQGETAFSEMVSSELVFFHWGVTRAVLMLRSA